MLSVSLVKTTQQEEIIYGPTRDQDQIVTCVFFLLLLTNITESVFFF